MCLPCIEYNIKFTAINTFVSTVINFNDKYIDTLCKYIADRMQFHTANIALNLLQNAITYSEKKIISQACMSIGHIWLSACF